MSRFFPVGPLAFAVVAPFGAVFFGVIFFAAVFLVVLLVFTVISTPELALDRLARLRARRERGARSTASAEALRDLVRSLSSARARLLGQGHCAGCHR